MKKIVLLAAIALLALILTGCGGKDKQSAASNPPPVKQESMTDLFDKGRNLPGITYDYVVKIQEGTGLSGKMWVAGKKMKIETVIEKQKMVTYLDGEANVVYNYLPEQNMLMKVPFDPSQANKSPDQYTKDTDAAKVKILETVVYDGEKCKVVILEEEKQQQVKLWVREDYGIPAKVEITEAGAVFMTAEYKNIKVAPVPPETFVLPQGVPVTDMSEMMKNLPEKP